MKSITELHEEYRAKLQSEFEAAMADKNLFQVTWITLRLATRVYTLQILFVIWLLGAAASFGAVAHSSICDYAPSGPPSLDSDRAHCAMVPSVFWPVYWPARASYLWWRP
jgi:hypothetical protein